VLLLPTVGTRAAAQDSARVVTPCDGRTVRAIVIRPQVPYYAGYGGQWQPLARTLASVHSTTRPNVIRSYLALQVGAPCSEIRRLESERLLRGLPFLSEARVTAFDDDSGGVRIDVFTADEISVLGAVSARSQAPHIVGLRLGDGNLLGEGIRVVGEWANGFELRDHYGARITDYQIAGHPYQLTIQGNRNQLGGDWSANLVHPFLTDLQRIGWIAEAGESRTYVSFLTPQSTESPTLDFSRHFGQVGVLARVGGRPGHVTLFGLSVAAENETVGDQPLLVGDSVVRDSNPALVARYSALKAARVNALFGFRAVSFLRVRGFDALNGEQDVQIGVRFGALVGRSVQVLGTTTNDVLLASTLYAGTGSPRSYVGVQANAQARRDLPTASWDDIMTAGRLAWYWKPSPAHTIIASTEFTLGVEQRLPFELTLSDLRGGVRGFHESQIGGGQRSVSRLEEHWLLGPFKDIGELGLAVFTDVGRMWAQDVPYGVNSRFEVGVGFGLLAAVPIHSKKVWRVDFAVPVTHDPTAGRYEIRFSNTDGSGRFYVEPHDVARARERTVPTSIFQYPPQ
jgi:hypothetical protein